MILTLEQIDDLKKGLTSESDFSPTLRARSSEYDEKVEKVAVAKVLVSDPDEKWECLKKNKLTWRIGQRKQPEFLFEDRVWCLFAKMGYNCLNKDRKWSLPYKKGDGFTKQIDIFAVNDETVVFVECKHTEEKGKMTSLKTDLESYKEIINGLHTAAKELFSGRCLKHKFVLATNNYRLSPNDRNRLQNLGGLHLSEENIEYFENLYSNIGPAAIYQFAGFVFDGNSIPALPNRVPAIKASMGGLKYYSFSIEPSTLLKMSYILHKNKANKGDMETYQRLVKGTRLKSIQSFINNDKGFFPNSIIINIRTDKEKSLQFDLAQKQESDADTQLGILHLPAKYKCVQIIDGQHRLLAYAGSEYAKTHAIPIVAFENLNSDMQIKLFMQINQNQKQVDKNLRNTLNAKILYESDLLSDRIRGMRLKIAEALANDDNSWLNGCVGSGVDDGKITSTAIDNALNMEVFLGRIKKNEILKNGIFFKGDEEKGLNDFKKFILLTIEYLVSNVSEVQQPGEDGYILTNRGIYGFLRCVGDILTLLRNKGESLDKVEDILDKVKPYLEPLIEFFNTKIKSNDEETISGLKTSYGGGADTRYMRTFEREIKKEKPDFNPEGLEEYWEKFSADNVNEAKDILNKLETTFRKNIVDCLKDVYKDAWFNKGIAKETKKILSNKLIEYNDHFPDNPTDEESMIDYSDMIEIILNNWELFKDSYAEVGVTGGRRDKLAWILKLYTIKKEIDLKPFIDKPNLDFLKQKKEQYLD